MANCIAIGAGYACIPAPRAPEPIPRTLYGRMIETG